MLKLALFLVAFFTLTFEIRAQEKEQTAKQIIENRIEYLLQSDEETEVDLTTLFDELYYLYDHPVNLNTVTKEELLELQLLNDLQAQNLIYHRYKYGPFVTQYELLNIEGFDETTIQQILPFITIQAIEEKQSIRLKNVVKYGNHTIILRHTRNFPDAIGFEPISDSLRLAQPNARYLGSPDRIYTRYRFQYGKQVSLGITGEKDPGEMFFKGDQKNGFDFYSAHLFLRNMGYIEKLALGDYQLQIGQGLTFWSGYAFRKSPDQTVNIKRFAQQIRPYTSTDENQFMRGAATQLKYKNLNLTLAYSNKRIDGNINRIVDTLTGEESVSASSLQISGLHRTPAELEDKHAVHEEIIAGNLSLDLKGFQIGISSAYTQFDQPLIKSTLPYYQLNNFQGQQNNNLGLNYQWTIGKFHFFGETGKSQNHALATINGLLMHLDSRFKLSILQRHYDKDYQSLYANAFGEKGGVQNESGIYFGTEFYPVKKVRINAFYDIYRFSWLAFRADAPSVGKEFSGQLVYTPNRKQELLFLFRNEIKQRNAANTELNTNILSSEISNRYRIQFSTKLNSWLSYRARLEFRTFHHTPEQIQYGQLLYNDLYFNLLNDKMTIKFRYALFDVDDYDARIYAYEHDLLYQFSVPAYHQKGSRIYGVIRYTITEHLRLNVKLAQTYYANRTYFGSGKDLINNRTRTELKTQIIYKF